MSKVVIFGNRDFASLAHYYLTNDSENEVVGFTVSKDYMPDTDTYEGKPIVPFENVEDVWPPETYDMFAPLNHGKPKIRQVIYDMIKEKGFLCINYISSRATVLTRDIGENCFILEDNTIQPYVNIGNNCVLWSGNHIGHHSQIKDHVLFTSHVVLSGHCVVEPHCFFGVNSTIRDGTCVAEGSTIGMGALVTKNTEPWGVYVGAPAKRIKDTPHD